MKKVVNGKYIDLTPEEIAEVEKQRKKFEELEKKREPTPQERLEALESAMLEMILGGIN